MTRVTIDAVERSYGAERVLRGVSLEVAEGEFAVLLGPSGCGKSTLLSAVAGLDEVQGGRILFDGEDVEGLEPAERNVGMVFQSYALYPSMRVRGNLSFGLETRGLDRDTVRERVARTAELLQIESLLDRRPSELSGGQRQRVAIGRALVRDTTLFLFDEPLSNLDAKLRTEMRVELKALHRRLGATFVYVTHDQVEAMTLATRIAVLDGGRIEQYASPKVVYDRPASLFVASFIGSPPMNLMPAHLAVEGGGAVARVGRFRVPVAPGTGRDGQAVTLGIRPEALLLASENGPAALEGEVLVTELLGADTLVWAEVEGRRIAVRATPAEAEALGDRIRLAVAPGSVSVFDPDGGARLEPAGGSAHASVGGPAHAERA